MVPRPVKLFPNLAGEGTPAGVFFSNFGPNQIPYIAAVYLWHVLWGLNLGLYYNPAPADAPEEAPDRARVEARAAAA